MSECDTSKKCVKSSCVIPLLRPFPSDICPILLTRCIYLLFVYDVEMFVYDVETKDI